MTDSRTLLGILGIWLVYGQMAGQVAIYDLGNLGGFTANRISRRHVQHRKNRSWTELQP